MKFFNFLRLPWSRCAVWWISVLSIGAVLFSRDCAFGQSVDSIWLPKGCVIVEGDILVPMATLQQTALATFRTTNFWPNGQIPFYFTPTRQISATKQQAMINAMAVWERVANVDFVPWTAESNRLEIDSAGVNNSYVGVVGGNQLMNIFNWESQGTLLHELGHCLGFWHEQARPDRDNFVQINWESIQTDQEDNFERHDDAGVYGPYDFESIMHYDECAFSEAWTPLCTFQWPCSCVITVMGHTIVIPSETITALPPFEHFQHTMGRFDALSRLDTLTMSFLYPESNWRFVDQNYIGTSAGTFLQPYIGFSPILVSLVVPEDGTVIIQPGDYPSVGTYSKRITVRAPLGGVKLGDFPKK